MPAPKDAGELTPTDFARVAVWQFPEDEGLHGETWMTPVPAHRVTTLWNRLVGTRVRLANGAEVWALLGGADLARAEINAHLLGVTLYRGGARFHLARYFDSDWPRLGPKALARFLGLRVRDVFPIRYDLRSVGRGPAAALCGTIEAEPAVRLTEAEREELLIEAMCGRARRGRA